MYSNNDTQVHLSNGRVQLSSVVFFSSSSLLSSLWDGARCWLIVCADPFCNFGAYRVELRMRRKILARLQCHLSGELSARGRASFNLSYTFHWIWGNCLGIRTWSFILHISWKYHMTSMIPSRLGASSVISVAMQMYTSPSRYVICQLSTSDGGGKSCS